MNAVPPGAARAYEHGGGYQPPKGGLTPRRIAEGVLGVALFLAAKWLLRTYLGDKMAEDVFQLAVSALAIPWIIRAILLPEMPDPDGSVEERRKEHIRGISWLIAWLIIMTVAATLSIQSLFFPG